MERALCVCGWSSSEAWDTRTAAGLKQAYLALDLHERRCSTACIRMLRGATDQPVQLVLA
jgi:hypothetical protein